MAAAAHVDPAILPHMFAVKSQSVGYRFFGFSNNGDLQSDREFLLSGLPLFLALGLPEQKSY